MICCLIEHSTPYQIWQNEHSNAEYRKQRLDKNPTHLIQKTSTCKYMLFVIFLCSNICYSYSE
jgi:hypothetical protein